MDEEQSTRAAGRGGEGVPCALEKDHAAEQHAGGAVSKTKVQQHGQLVEVPCVELVVKAARERHADQVGGEEDEGDVWECCQLCYRIATAA